MEEKIPEKKDKKWIEPVVYGIFIVLSVTMFFFHELWYDEIQAYMLAKDASFHELIFVATHYEGHPPLFSLLLAIFAKTNVPVDIGLRIVSFAFSLVGAYLVIFKAPFKKWVRCLIPFTFFIFYQYTVICRPYAMMFAAFMLAACFFKTRNEKPLRYILSLYLLCWCSSYGMLFAGCFCAIWLVEIIASYVGKNKKSNSGEKGAVEKGRGKGILSDKRFWCLMGILVGAVIILYLIYPKPDAFATNFYNKEHPVRAMIYTFFMMPADAMFTDVGFFGSLQNNSYQFVNGSAVSIGAYFISIAILAVTYFVTYVHRRRRMFFIPYAAFATFAAVGYMCNHHIGITVLYIVFLMWICYDETEEEKKNRRSLPAFFEKLNVQYNKLTLKLGWFVLILCLGMSLLWTGMSCFNDITHEVWYAKSLNQIFEDYNLTGYRIIADWSYLPVVDGKIVYAYGDSAELLEVQEELNENEKEKEAEADTVNPEAEESEFFYDINIMRPEDYYQFPTLTNFADIVAYNSEGKNYISNFNDGDDHKRYIEHHCPTREGATEYCLQLGQMGYPDIIIGDPNIIGLMGLNILDTEYIPIYEIRIYRPYKYHLTYQRSYVYLRSDLFDTRDNWPIMDQYRGTLSELVGQ